MSRAYDPIDYETWPAEQQEFAGRVWRGLHDGDLQPLADYLRAGHYIEPALANEIADAIEQKDVGYFHLKTKGRQPGQVGMTALSDRHRGKMAIGVFMETRIRAIGRGGYASAEQETMDYFGITSSSTVAKALSYARAYVGRSKFAHGEEETWSLLFDIYIGPST